MSIGKSFRFDLLDGLRGLAAIAVMIYHFTQHNGLHWLRGAWVAVDLFFILSGFVIAHSYGAKLLDGMSFRSFMLVRLIRLGPLYLFGLILGVVAATLSMCAGELGDITAMQLGAAAALGAMWLPYPNDSSWPFGHDAIHGPIFPLNDPAWSLFFEIFVNGVFFLCVRRFRKLSSIALVCISSFVFITCTVLFDQSNSGWATDNFIFGFPRVMAGFFVGALIYQLGFHEKSGRPGLTMVIGLSVFLLFILGKRALLNSITLIPLIVALASAVKIEKGGWKALCKALGNISYPIYIVHFPVYRLVWHSQFFQSMTPVSQTMAVCAICLVIAHMLATIDAWLRKILMSRASPLMGQLRPVRSGGN